MHSDWLQCLLLWQLPKRRIRDVLQQRIFLLGLVGKGPSNEVGISLALQFTDNGTSYHTSMAGNIDF